MKAEEKYGKIIYKDLNKFIYKHSINGTFIYFFVAIGFGLIGCLSWLQADGGSHLGIYFCFLLTLLFIWGGIFGEEIDESEFNLAKGTLTIFKARHGKSSSEHIYKSLDFRSITWTDFGVIINLHKESVVYSGDLQRVTKTSNPMQTAYELGRIFHVPKANIFYVETGGN
jgi:hypothetical protein